MIVTLPQTKTTSHIYTLEGDLSAYTAAVPEYAYRTCVPSFVRIREKL